jgi:MFS family permease
MTPDDKMTISLFISGFAVVATIFQPVINIYASRRMNTTPDEQVRRTGRRHALRGALIKLLGSSWFFPVLSILTCIASIYYQLTRTGPVTRLTILEISVSVASVSFCFATALVFSLISRMLDAAGRHIESTGRLGDVALHAHERLDRIE